MKKRHRLEVLFDADRDMTLESIEFFESKVREMFGSPEQANIVVSLEVLPGYALDTDQLHKERNALLAICRTILASHDEWLAEAARHWDGPLEDDQAMKKLRDILKEYE